MTERQVCEGCAAAEGRIRELEVMLKAPNTLMVNPVDALRKKAMEAAAERIRELEGQLAAVTENEARYRDELLRVKPMLGEAKGQAAAMRALLEPMLQPDIWWCPQCKMETGATHEERCVTCGHVFADNPPADAIRAALSPEAGRRVAEVVEAARTFDRFLDSANSGGGVWADYVPEAVLAAWDGCEAALAALDAGKEGGA